MVFLSELISWLSELSSIDIDIIFIDFSFVFAGSVLD